MKLKNSHILLIAMAIFLLVGIGSVCASEDITTDVNLASDGSDVVLADNTNTGTTEDTTQKIDTSVVSSDVKVNEKENKVINVAVKDNESQTILIAKENLTVSENNKTIGFTYNNSQITISDKLDLGNHSLIINYLGNDIYKNSTTKIILSIFGNNTLEVPSTAQSKDGKSVEIPVKLTDGVDDNTNLLNSTNTEILLISKDGNATINVEDALSKNKLTIDVTGKVPATLIVNYTENNKTISKKVDIKYLSQVNVIKSKDISEKDNLTFVVNVLDNENNPIANITKSNLTITGVKDFSYNSTTKEVLITGLKKGIHELTITYKGNELFNASSNTTVANVRGSVDINVNKTSIDMNSTKKGEIVIINITNGVDILPVTKDNLSISASYKSGNNTTAINIKSEIKNGNILFELENGDFTTATLTINYNNGESLKNITLNRIYNAKIEAVNTVNEYQNGNFTFKLIDVDTNTPLSNIELNLYTVGNIRAGFSAKTDANGIATFKTTNLYEFDNTNSSFTMRQLEVGNHGVELSTKDAIKSTALTVNLTITKANINIKIENFKEYYGTNKNVTITVTNANNGQPVPSIILHLSMPQTSGKDYYFQTDSDGQSKISVTQLVGGTYDITVSNNDTTNINKKEVKGSITIVPKPVNLAITSSLTIYYNSGNTAVIKVTDKTGAALSGVYVTIQFDNEKSYLLGQTNNKGEITFQASLTVGKHRIVVNTADNRYKANQLTKTITVKKESGTFTAPKVTAYYKQGKYFTITLKNSKTKKAIYDAKVNIRVYISSTQYYNYNGNTGANGQLKLLIDLKPGTYKVEVRSADSKAYAAKMITSKIVVKKAPTKLTPTKLTAKKGANKYFKVTVKNTKTKKVITGVKVKIKVYTGKKYKTYTVKTNKKGIAKLNVKSLKVGTHKVVVTSGNKYCVAKTAKSTIKITK